jgi:probable F420-dependent oxidoreductase
MAMQLGRLGVWAAMDVMSAADGALFAQRVEGWGYAALWLPESRGRNVLVHSSWLLANTKNLIVAPGIANIYARDPMAMANGQRALAEQSGGRFLLGLGVSHVPSVEGVRGHTYGRPVATMRAYLQAMRAAPYGAPEPAEKPLTILAALGPRMLALSSSHADGSHPYNVTPEHTAEARRIMGPGKLLCPEIWVLLESDPAKARALGRQALANYLRLDNYVNNWRRLGFGDDDFAGGGSDRFVDANVAWGGEAAIRRRIEEHWAAGADHVCIQSISPDGSRRPDEKVLALLAPKGRF